jgi:hypothetical protein
MLVNRGTVEHAEVIQPEEGIGPLRRVLAWLLIAMFFLTLVPVPLRL